MQQYDMKISLGGHTCLWPDANGQLMEHINRHYSYFFEPAENYNAGSSVVEQLSCNHKQPLILPQWNQEPRLRLYQFYDPAGMSRAGKCFVLMKRENLESLDQNYHSFKVDWDSLDKTSGWWFYREMQVTRRVHVTDDVVLVEIQDVRHLCKEIIFRPDYSPDNTTVSLVDFLDNLYAVSLQEQFQAGYLERGRLLENLPSVNVDLKSLWRPGSRVTHLIDAALGALSVSPFYYQESKSRETFAISYEANYKNSSDLPVEVVFPIMTHGALRDDERGGHYGIMLRDGFGPTVTCSAPAHYISRDSVAPLNSVELSGLSIAIYGAEGISSVGRVMTRQVLHAYSREKVYWPSTENSIDSLIFDFNADGGGMAMTVVPCNQFPLQRHYYWIKDTKPTCEPMDVIRVQLLENLPVCSDAAAVHLSNLEDTESCPCGFVRQVLVRDTAGIARTRIQNNQRFAPVQSMGFARHLACADTGDMDVYELISIGQGCCPPPDSSDVPNCCQQWFTRYENLGTVTDKSVGAVIATGEVIGSLKVTGGDYWLDYKAYLSNSDSSDGCGIDLSGIHEFSQEKTSRTSGTSPCSPSATQCAIDFALLQMSGRLPVEKAACNIWYEDLGGAGNGNDYHRRRLKSTLPGCAAGKKVYNVSSVLTTVLTKGADYVVLKHWCADASSSSSSGADECCAQFTDYDMRCVGGVLQRWKKETEVCWNGDCLDTRIISDWAPTGQTAGCCSCTGSESGSSGGGGGVQTTCCPSNLVPTVLNVTISGGACNGTYTMSYSSGTSEWIADNGPPDTSMRLSCSGGIWYLTIAQNGYSPTTSNCNPFSLSFVIASDPICGNFTITITG